MDLRQGLPLHALKDLMHGQYDEPGLLSKASRLPLQSLSQSLSRRVCKGGGGGGEGGGGERDRVHLVTV